MDKELVPLYITDCIEVLDALVEKDDAIKSVKKAHRFSNIVNKMMSELLQCQDDQEKCYILSRRYINLVDHLFKISDDQSYTRSLYMGDYRKVQQIIEELRASLEQRYKVLSELKMEDGPVSPDSSKPPSVCSSSGGSYIKPNSANERPVEQILLEDMFITPADLFSIIIKLQNVLLVDVRSSESFKDSRIHLESGFLINIPADLIVPGLSANTLGQRLEPEVKDVWDRRDTFDIIVLMDYDTQTYTFAGSKLEQLRIFIVEWDFNRSYKREPFILNGGLKEFVECYPTEVDNPQAFLSQTNSEIDELLDLESISYPETGAGTHMNLKLHSINSVGNLESRILRDFGELDKEIGDEPSLHSRSEGNLPRDYYTSKDSLRGPYRSLSQENLHRDYLSPDALIELLPPKEEKQLTELYSVDKNVEAMATDEANEIQAILAGKKADLLRQARQAVKPKLIVDDIEDGDKADDEDDDSSESRSETRSSKRIATKPPAVNRTFKPSLPSEGEVVYGQGYTGLKNQKNICYMNCILQCLKVIPIIKSTYVTSDRYLKHQTRTPAKMNPHLAAVLREIWGGSFYHHKYFLITRFKDKVCEIAPMYDRNTHEDTFEFFMFLFNLISDDCALDLPRPQVMTESEKAWYGHLQGRTSFLVDTFYYQLKNTKICWNCRRTNLSFETDSTLMLPVYQRVCDLQVLIDDYMKENLVPDYSCSDCKSTSTIVNMKEIVVDPDVLVIVLKRYISNADGTFRKNDAPIEFPLRGLRFGSSKYACYAIVQHNGTIGHGHYFASVLLNDKKKHWVLFNDEQVMRYNCIVNESFGIKVSAAGFFYVRQ